MVCPSFLSLQTDRFNDAREGHSAAGIKIPRGFQSSPEGDSGRLLHLFPPLKRRAIARRPARAGLESRYARRFCRCKRIDLMMHERATLQQGLKSREVFSRPLKGTPSSLPTLSRR